MRFENIPFIFLLDRFSPFLKRRNPLKVAEGEGFEPPKALTPCWFSRLLSLIKNPCLIVVSEHEGIQKVFKKVFNSGGRGGIRTHEGFNSLLVFKTSAFNQTLSPFHDRLSQGSHCSK